jgi:molybdopterin converting factor subunit 1
VFSFTVRLFASYRDYVGKSTVSVEMPQGSSVFDLITEIVEMYPSLTGEPGRLVVAVNYEYVDYEYCLVEGDEVALIPPVSGGSK